MDGAAFHFIHYDSVHWHGSPDPQIRTQIKRQAMQKTAQKRRQRRNHGQVNLGQPLVWSTESVPNTIKPSYRRLTVDRANKNFPSPSSEQQLRVPPTGVACYQDWYEVTQAQISEWQHLNPRMPSSNFEKVCGRFNMCPDDLSALTVAHIGPISSDLLTQSPHLLASILPRRQRSYLSLLGHRFGVSVYLDAALQCLLGRVYSHVVASSDNASRRAVFHDYGKALNSLQIAINDPNEWASPDILCTIQLLALSEVC